jgi:CYTH domain-containing protein
MMRTGADEALTPKYAHIERERRWLVDPLRRPDLSALSYTLIEDLYIDGTRIRLRRMTDSETGKSALKLTKKYDAADPLARPIVTTYLTEGEYALVATLPGSNLTKKRYKVVEDNIEYGIDQFSAALEPLELAEIEWPDDDGLRALASPAWAVKDVSNDIAYQGGTLAACGIPKDI